MNSVAARVAAVGAMSPTALRQAWTKQFGSEPPDWPPSLMARAITYAMQAKRHGGLSKRVTKYLDRVADALETRASADTIATITKVAPGTRMVREWHGRVYHVEAMRDGRFLFEGTPYRSLTQITRKITGVVWSGPKFFGVVA